MSELSAKITGDIKDLDAKLDKAKKLLKETGTVADKTGKQISNSIGKKGANSLNKLKKSTTNVTPTLLEFNRTIQDAPFGIQGVANNIQQLTANFGNLQQKTGSTSSSLKLLAKGLLGPQGILLGVSAITSLLVVYGDRLVKTSSLIDDLAKSTATFVASTKTEINELKNLIAIANDDVVSRRARVKAVEQINNKYSEYLGNLDLELIKTSGVKSSVDALTKSLLKQAQVRGVQALIEEKFKDSAEDLISLQLQQRQAGKNVRDEINKLRTSVSAFNNIGENLPINESLKEFENIVNRSGGSGSGKLQLLNQLVGDFNVAGKEVRDFTADFENELRPLQGLLKDFTIQDLFNSFDDLSNEVVLTLPKVKAPKPPELREYDRIFEVTEQAQKEIEKRATKNFTGFKNRYGILLSEIFSKEIPKNNSIKPELDRQIQLLLDFAQQANDVVSNSIAGAFSGIGESIGNALANGGNVLQAIGQGLLGSLGKFLSEMGGLLIKYGTLAVIKGKLDIAIAAGGPLAIGAGLAAIAVGVALKAAGAAIGSAASGGSGSSGGGGDFQGSTSTFSSSGGGSGTVVFEIAGTKLVGVLQRTLDRNSRLGGNLSLN